MVGRKSGKNVEFWGTEKLIFGLHQIFRFLLPLHPPWKVSVNSSQNTLRLVVPQHIIPKPMILIGADLGQFLIVTEG